MGYAGDAEEGLSMDNDGTGDTVMGGGEERGAPARDNWD